MIKNFFKIAWRSLLKNRSFSILNISGLAVGMTGALLIFAWIQNELSYDQFHTNKNELYKLWNRSVKVGNNPVGCWDVTTAAAGPALQQNFPEVKATARVYWPNERLFNYGDKAITATGLDVDKPFLTMFSFPLIEGNAAQCLNDVNGVVLTAKLAKKIFDNKDPMGQLVKVNNGSIYKVTGVLKDLPNNTQFDFEYLVSLAGLSYLKYNEAQWNSNGYNTYIQLKPGTNVAAFNNKIKNLVLMHDKQVGEELFVHPISKWRLYSNFENGIASGGRIETVRLMAVIASLILLIACINFMNMSTARSVKRAKEVGVRKVIGASRLALIRQFLIESVLIAAISGVLAIVIVQLCLPAFNQLTDKKLYMHYNDPLLWAGLAGFITLTGLLAGSYPALFLSGFNPTKVLKGSVASPNSLVSPRKVLVVVQFSVAIVLVVSTLIIYQQIHYAQSRESGYVQNNLVEHPINGDIGKNYEPLKNELISSGAITAMCKVSTSVTLDASSTSGVHWGDRNPDQSKINFSQLATTGDFAKTVGLKIIEGRDIDISKYPSDTSSVVINESAASFLGYKHPVGQSLFYGNSSKPIAIVGVIKNFVIGSPYQPVGPMIVNGSNKWWYNAVNFRLNPKNSVARNLEIAAPIFKKYNPAYPFAYKFVDEVYNQKFTDEVRTGKLAGVFSLLTILISCLGLFGLAAYMAESRAKEIGIRKVLGASVNNIIKLLTGEFVVLVGIAILIATPIGWYAMNKWLLNFSYRISLSWLSFVVAGLFAILIAVVTVSSQALKAALSNPVKSIKDE